VRVLERSPASSCKQCPVTRRIVFLWLEIVLVRRVPLEGVRERIVPVARHVEGAREEVPLRVDRDPRVGVRRVAVRLVAVRLVVIRLVVARLAEVQRDAHRVVAGVMIEPMDDVEVVTVTLVVNRARVKVAGSRVRVTPVVNRARVKVAGSRVRVMVVGTIVGPAVRRELAETIADCHACVAAGRTAEAAARPFSITFSAACAMAVLSSTPSTPSSSAAATSLAVPTPASTIIG